MIAAAIDSSTILWETGLAGKVFGTPRSTAPDGSILNTINLAAPAFPQPVFADGCVFAATSAGDLTPYRPAADGAAPSPASLTTLPILVRGSIGRAARFCQDRLSRCTVASGLSGLVGGTESRLPPQAEFPRNASEALPELDSGSPARGARNTLPDRAGDSPPFQAEGCWEERVLTRAQVHGSNGVMK
jgi:hypothetical protein